MMGSTIDGKKAYLFKARVGPNYYGTFAGKEVVSEGDYATARLELINYGIKHLSDELLLAEARVEALRAELEELRTKGMEFDEHE